MLIIILLVGGCIRFFKYTSFKGIVGSSAFLEALNDEHLKRLLIAFLLLLFL